MNLKSVLLVAVLVAESFCAGYILPNGKVVYDGEQDGTVYKVDKLSPQNQNQSINNEPLVDDQKHFGFETNYVVVENRKVVYERPVYIRERVVEHYPYYDVVDLAGSVLIYGLLYDTKKRSFYHRELHRDRSYGKYHHHNHNHNYRYNHRH